MSYTQEHDIIRRDYAYAFEYCTCTRTGRNSIPICLCWRSQMSYSHKRSAHVHGPGSEGESGDRVVGGVSMCVFRAQEWEGKHYKTWYRVRDSVGMRGRFFAHARQWWRLISDVPHVEDLVSSRKITWHTDIVEWHSLLKILWYLINSHELFV